MFIGEIYFWNTSANYLKIMSQCFPNDKMKRFEIGK